MRRVCQVWRSPRCVNCVGRLQLGSRGSFAQLSLEGSGERCQAGTSRMTT